MNSNSSSPPSDSSLPPSNSGLPSAPGSVFESYLKGGEFRLQSCTHCGRQIYYPRTLCPFCGSVDLNWRAVSGEGTVYSTTTVRQRPERGGDYNVSLIDLAEGARMLSRVENRDAAAVRIGMPVQAVIIEANGQPLVVFRPRSGS